MIDQVRAGQGIYIPPFVKPEKISKTEGPVVLENIKTFINQYKHTKNEYLKGHFRKQTEGEKELAEQVKQY